MLSTYEMELVTNAEIILTKNRIIQKVYEMFGLLSEQFVQDAGHILPAELVAIGPKISRGENYLGLPYVMLDYPRNFGKEDTFGIRTFFWWGNFFSITLQLSGCYKEKYLPSIQAAVGKQLLTGWFVGIHSSQWHHHFGEDNYMPLTQNFYSAGSKSFIKIANKIAVKDWNKAANFINESFKDLLAAVSS